MVTPYILVRLLGAVWLYTRKRQLHMSQIFPSRILLVRV